MLTSRANKEDLDKISKLSKEVSRKDNMIKELKVLVEELREKELKLANESKLLSTKLKAAKSDLVRKETIVKELKNKLENIQNDIKNASEKSNDQVKNKEMLKKYKQEIDRKDLKISGLESRLETNSSEIERLKSENIKESRVKKSEFQNQSKKYDSVVKKVKKSEDVTQCCVVIIRRIVKDMILTVEKLRSDVVISNHELSTRKQPNMNVDCKPIGHDPILNAKVQTCDNHQNTASDMYKESLDILGVSLNELEEFVQPETSNTNLPIYDYTNEGNSLPSESKKSFGPGLQFEDLGVPSDNKDLDVFNKVLEAIVEDPQQLIEDSEDIVKIFKKLLKEIMGLEKNLTLNNKSIQLGSSHC